MQFLTLKLNCGGLTVTDWLTNRLQIGSTSIKGGPIGRMTKKEPCTIKIADATSNLPVRTSMTQQREVQ